MADREITYTLTVKDTDYEPVVTITIKESTPLTIEQLLEVFRWNLTRLEERKAANELGTREIELELWRATYGDGTSKLWPKRVTETVLLPDRRFVR